jgi:hypothetical protein
MENLVNMTVQFAHLLNELVTESQPFIESLAAVVSTLTKMAGLLSQAVELLGSVMSNGSTPI